MRTGLTKSQKITEICFDECRQTDADPDTGCMEFVIRKGRFSFRLTAPYSEERRRAASAAAKKCGVHRNVAYLSGDEN